MMVKWEWCWCSLVSSGLGVGAEPNRFSASFSIEPLHKTATTTIWDSYLRKEEKEAENGTGRSQSIRWVEEYLGAVCWCYKTYNVCIDWWRNAVSNNFSLMLIYVLYLCTGFSVNASSERLNMGEIETVEDFWDLLTLFLPTDYVRSQQLPSHPITVCLFFFFLFLFYFFFINFLCCHSQFLHIDCNQEMEAWKYKENAKASWLNWPCHEKNQNLQPNR